MSFGWWEPRSRCFRRWRWSFFLILSRRDTCPFVESSKELDFELPCPIITTYWIQLNCEKFGERMCDIIWLINDGNLTFVDCDFELDSVKSHYWCCQPKGRQNNHYHYYYNILLVIFSSHTHRSRFIPSPQTYKFVNFNIKYIELTA